MEGEEGGLRLSKRINNGEVDYKTKSGTAWSHSYLNQKPWHPLSYPNQRRKWIAEQTHANHERRAEEVAREVKTPALFLLGAQYIRVPVSNGLQYARALKEKGVEVKVVVFPNDVHSIDRPQSDFESFLNIGVWFNKYCK